MRKFKWEVGFQLWDGEQEPHEGFEVEASTMMEALSIAQEQIHPDKRAFVWSGTAQNLTFIMEAPGLPGSST
jgi:hypothetical protein